MANFDPAFVTELAGRITAVWTDVSYVVRSTAADRVQLENEIRESVTTLPIALIGVGQRVEDPNWGLNNQCYRYPTHIWYIGSIQGVTSVTTFFEGKLASLRDNLINTATTAFQVIDYPSSWVEDMSDVNQLLSGLQEGMFSGELILDALVGETL